jgi:hypothetical protein
VSELRFVELLENLCPDVGTDYTLKEATGAPDSKPKRWEKAFKVGRDKKASKVGPSFLKWKVECSCDPYTLNAPRNWFQSLFFHVGQLVLATPRAPAPRARR